MSKRMTVSQLRARAKAQGFKRYSTLNKDELVFLIKHGYHKPDEEPLWRLYVPGDHGEGVPLEKIFTTYDENNRYWFSEQNTPEGKLIGGVNLKGLFKSKFIPRPVATQPRHYDYEGYFSSDNEEDYYTGATYFYDVKERGGWLIPHSEYNAFKLFMEELRTEAFRQDPKTLFELAGRTVNSRHYTKAEIPKCLQERIRDFK